MYRLVVVSVAGSLIACTVGEGQQRGGKGCQSQGMAASSAMMSRMGGGGSQGQMMPMMGSNMLQTQMFPRLTMGGGGYPTTQMTAQGSGMGCGKKGMTGNGTSFQAPTALRTPGTSYTSGL